MTQGPFLYPSVTSLPQSTEIAREQKSLRKPGDAPGEFDQVFEKELNQVKEPLKFSAHASQRVRDRKISMDPAMMSKINDAVDKAEAKGIEDTLVLTSDAAFIVNVKNRTVITALDRNSAAGNVFTNIDGAVVV